MTELIYAWDHIVDGVTIGQIRRFASEHGKDDIPCYNTGRDGFSKGIPERLKPLPPLGLETYRDVNKTLIICEGQKCQAAWAYLGFQAVTSIGGAKNVFNCDWSPLRMAKKIILSPDKDDAGETYIRDVWATVQKYGAEIKIVRLPVEQKGDICDWIVQKVPKWDQYEPINARDAARILPELQKLLLFAEPVPAGWAKEADWEEPEALDPELAPLPKLPRALLPASLAPWLLSLSHRMNCPLDFVAVPALVAAGAVIGSRCRIRPKRYDSDWEETPNVWGGIVGQPGQLKTPALRKALGPLYRLDERSAGDHKEKMRTYEAAQAAYETDSRRAKKAFEGQKRGSTERMATQEEFASLEPPVKPPRERFIVNSSTVQALQVVLADNPRGVLIFRDELLGLLESWKQQSKESDRQFYLELWNGQGKFTHDTLSRGTTEVSSLCASILGGIQKDRLKAYLSEQQTGSNDGLLQRFQMLVYPDPLKDVLIDEAPDAIANERAHAVFSKIADADFLDFGAKRNPDETAYFNFSPEAQALFNEWYEDLGMKIAQEQTPVMAEHLSKYRKLMPALSLILHVLDCAAGNAIGPVSEDSARLAAAWCGYLEYHARRIYKLLKPAKVLGAQILMQRIASGDLSGKFTARHVYRRGWAMLDTPEKSKAACEELVEAGWLHRVLAPPGRSGPKKSEYEINPRLPIREFVSFGSFVTEGVFG